MLHIPGKTGTQLEIIPDWAVPVWVNFSLGIFGTMCVMHPFYLDFFFGGWGGGGGGEGVKFTVMFA